MSASDKTLQERCEEGLFRSPAAPTWEQIDRSEGEVFRFFEEKNRGLARLVPERRACYPDLLATERSRAISFTSMKVLNQSVDLDRFFQEIRETKRAVLFLRYDGVLAPIPEGKTEVLPYEGIFRALEELVLEGRTRVVLVAGLLIAQVRPHVPFEPGLEIWGSHGREHLTLEGDYELAPISRIAEGRLLKALRWVRQSRLDAKRCEPKPGCLTLQRRGLSPEEFESARKRWLPFTAGGHLELEEREQGLELRVPGYTERKVVEMVLSEVPEPRRVAYLGWDSADERVFEFLKGTSLCVAVRRTCKATKADLWLKPPRELVGFLHRWASSIRTGEGDFSPS